MYRPARLDQPESGVIGYTWISTSTAIWFDFLILILDIWEEFKVLSRFIQKLIQSPAFLDHGLFRILSSYWLSHFSLLKKSAKVRLYFGLDFGLLVFFAIVILSQIFRARFGGKDHGLCTYKPRYKQAGGLDAFLYLPAQNFELFSNIQDLN